MGNKDERLEGARENLWCFNERAVSYKKFLQLWDEFYPDVVISKPMMDLCLTCQQNTTKLQRAANL